MKMSSRLARAVLMRRMGFPARLKAKKASRQTSSPSGLSVSSVTRQRPPSSGSERSPVMCARGESRRVASSAGGLGGELHGGGAGEEPLQVLRRVAGHEAALRDDEYRLTHGLDLGEDVAAEYDRVARARGPL